MVKVAAFLVLLGLAAASALPTSPVISTLGNDLRYQYAQDANGSPRLVDSWLKTSDLEEVARYNPDSENLYHLFTRDNPTVSQPLLMGSEGLLGATNYNSQRRTVIIIHGWLNSATSEVNAVLVPAFLSGEDLNVIVVDWSAGAGTINYIAAVANTLTSGEGVARFINWLNAATGTSPLSYHIVGHSLGGHQAGIVGRNVVGDVAYITSLDPAFPLWITNDDRFRQDDGQYTEVIHTNSGLLGYLSTLGHVDFYPNGGINMPGCSTQECDHDRAFYYMAESVVSGGFTGRRCATYIGAMVGDCFLWGTLPMGGLVPKTGQSGVFWLETNAAPPFSRD